MPFLKFSRDKRGYEHFYLVQPDSRRGRSRPRVLYWFRTPPNVKVGREPFDDDVRRAIEAQNPGVTFDWPKLLERPIPPDIEHWRERRRAEKAARQVARAEVEAEPESASETPDVAVAEETGTGISSDAEKGTAILPDANKDTRPHKRRRRRRRRGRGPRPDVVTPPSAPEPPPDEPDSDV